MAAARTHYASSAYDGASGPAMASSAAGYSGDALLLQQSLAGAAHRASGADYAGFIPSPPQSGAALPRSGASSIIAAGGLAACNLSGEGTRVSTFAQSCAGRVVFANLGSRGMTTGEKKKTEKKAKRANGKFALYLSALLSSYLAAQRNGLKSTVF
jgi:hypothetical protein